MKKTNEWVGHANFFFKSEGNRTTAGPGRKGWLLPGLSNQTGGTRRDNKYSILPGLRDFVRNIGTWVPHISPVGVRAPGVHWNILRNELDQTSVWTARRRLFFSPHGAPHPPQPPPPRWEKEQGEVFHFLLCILFLPNSSQSLCLRLCDPGTGSTSAFPQISVFWYDEVYFFVTNCHWWGAVLCRWFMSCADMISSFVSSVDFVSIFLSTSIPIVIRNFHNMSGASFLLVDSLVAVSSVGVSFLFGSGTLMVDSWVISCLGLMGIWEFMLRLGISGLWRSQTLIKNFRDRIS